MPQDVPQAAEDAVDWQKNFQNSTVDAFFDTLQNAIALPQAVDELDAGRMTSLEVGQTPSDVVYSENKLDLLHYEPLTEQQHEKPILVVYALINKPYILDLQPDRSVIRTLLRQGFDVYMIDWGEPSRLDAQLGLRDYVDRYIANCVDVVRERSDEDSISILGYCMGGTMSAMYTARNPDKVHNLALMASGLSFDGDGGTLELWGDGDYFDPWLVHEAFDNAPEEFLDAGFDLMEPVENTFSKYVRLFDRLDDPDHVRNFGRMEKWLNDGPDVAGRVFAEFVERIYQKNQLHRNQLEIAGRPVDIEEIDVPILQIVAEYDHLMPPECSVPFNEVVASTDTEVIEHPTGHIGLSVSRDSQENLWPDVADWFEERAGDTVEPRPETRATGKPSHTTPVSDVDGIGPTYTERLNQAGIATIEDMGCCKASEIAEYADVSESRARNWLQKI